MNSLRQFLLNYSSFLFFFIALVTILVFLITLYFFFFYSSTTKKTVISLEELTIKLEKNTRLNFSHEPHLKLESVYNYLPKTFPESICHDIHMFLMPHYLFFAIICIIIYLISANVFFKFYVCIAFIGCYSDYIDYVIFSINDLPLERLTWVIYKVDKSVPDLEVIYETWLDKPIVHEPVVITFQDAVQNSHNPVFIFRRLLLYVWLRGLNRLKNECIKQLESRNNTLYWEIFYVSVILILHINLFFAVHFAL